MNNAEEQLIAAAKEADVFLEEVIFTFPRWELIDEVDDVRRDLNAAVERYVEARGRALAGSDDAR